MKLPLGPEAKEQRHRTLNPRDGPRTLDKMSDNGIDGGVWTRDT